jgi:hypothetical protein
MSVYDVFEDGLKNNYYIRMMWIASDLAVMVLGEVEIFELKELKESNSLD